MSSKSYTGGVNFSWPIKTDTNWDSVVDAALTIISAHNHSGGLPFVSNVPSGTTQTIDWSQGINQVLDLSSASGNVTLTFSNPTDGVHYTLLIKQGATPRTIVWPSAVYWLEGTSVPTFSSTSAVYDAVSMVYQDSVTKYRVISPSPSSIPTSGTWTPSFELTSGSVTYNTQVGAYTKVNDTVFISFTTVITSVSSPINNALAIGGLPYTARNTTNLLPGSVFHYQDNVANLVGGDVITGRVNPSTTHILLTKFNAGTTSAISASALKAGTVLCANMQYFV